MAHYHNFLVPKVIHQMIQILEESPFRFSYTITSARASSSNLHNNRPNPLPHYSSKQTRSRSNTIPLGR
jgi:hypothetical protein